MDNSTQYRLRIAFAKQGRLAWLSHLEIVRAMERVIRRAELPIMLSQGFNQHIKHSFSPALPVGTASLCEYCDVWLVDYIPPETVLANLRAVTVTSLPILSCEYIGKTAPALQVCYCIATYQLTINTCANVFEQKLAELIAAGTLIIKRKGKNKEYNLAKIIQSWRLLRKGECELSKTVLELVLRSDNDGSLRPELLVAPVLEQLPGSKLLKIVRTNLRDEG